MKIDLNFKGFSISAKGMSINRKKMDLIAENIANTETTKMENGKPYQRKFLRVFNEVSQMTAPEQDVTLDMKGSDKNHITAPISISLTGDEKSGIDMKELIDSRPGEMVYSPEHPDADKDGYVLMPNVNIITEMVDMISATRSYEANVTAFNQAKQMAKDGLDI